jgi:hypothetical protein
MGVETRQRSSGVIPAPSGLIGAMNRQHADDSGSWGSPVHAAITHPERRRQATPSAPEAGPTYSAFPLFRSATSRVSNISLGLSAPVEMTMVRYTTASTARRAGPMKASSQ